MRKHYISKIVVSLLLTACCMVVTIPTIYAQGRWHNVPSYNKSYPGDPLYGYRNYYNIHSVQRNFDAQRAFSRDVRFSNRHMKRTGERINPYHARYYR